ncbi:MAG: NAD(P)-dependent oxidoreductase [Cyclobacteriaceae bacterium]
MKVFFFEAFEEEAEAIRRFLPAHVEAGFTWKTIQEYDSRKLPAPIISVRTQSAIPTEWASEMEAIITRSTGYDHILAYRKASGVHVNAGYLPLYCNRAVAEQAMLLWMSLMRKLPQQISNFRHFHRDGITGKEAEKKTLLVVGVGNIGREVVRIGKGLDMNVLCVDIEKKLPEEKYISIEEGLPLADVVVCAMNLTEENYGYFSYERLKQARPGLVFVNVSRGEQSPSGDLLRLLEEGHLGGIGMDVYINEKELAVSLREGKTSSDPQVKATLQLLEKPNVIFTPHNAFNTDEAVEKKAGESVDQLMHFLKHGEFFSPVPI